MLKNLNNTFRKRFALKLKKKDVKCTTINYTVQFYENLIEIQSDDLLKILRLKNFPVDFNFCMNAIKINEIIKDPYLEDLALSRLSGSIDRQGIKSESTFFQILEAFYENLKFNPKHPLSKELLESLNKNSFLFTAKERKRLHKLLTEEKQNLQHDKDNQEDLFDDADLEELGDGNQIQENTYSSSSASDEENMKDLKDTKGYKKLVKNNELKDIEKIRRPLNFEESLKGSQSDSKFVDKINKQQNFETYQKKPIDPLTGNKRIVI
jgi:hypothetical protein